MTDNNVFKDNSDGVFQGIADGYIISPLEQKNNFLMIVDLLALAVEAPAVCRHLIRHKRNRIFKKNLHRIQRHAKLFLKRNWKLAKKENTGSDR